MSTGVVGTVYPTVAGHEARHCAAGVLLGLDVKEARADCPTPRTAGHVTTIGPMATPREFGLMVLVGGLDNDDDWPPRWPPDKSSELADERQLAEVVERLGLDKAGYLGLYEEALQLAASRRFRSLAAGYEALTA